jgi:UDP-N-acetylglucosamine--N-acetylmuramyl-(pentapeptide) pyrophosphoryl-undecaprenol N-acetylglucosamine transferase
VTEHKKKNILVVASGTGGHLFPALSFSKVFTEAATEALQVNFLGTGRPLESSLVDKHGYPRFEYKITGVSKLGLSGILKFLLGLPAAWKSLRKLFADLQPALVVGFGGYATVLPLLMAKFAGIPTVIFEAEKKAGLANQFLAYFVTEVATAYASAQGISRRVIEVGRILRPGLLGFNKQLAPAVRRILVMGGSQGCRSIDLGMLAMSSALAKEGLELWHQSRPEHVELLREKYRAAGLAARVDAFIENPEEAYLWADLVVSRAGAGAVLEICVASLPAVLVPLPKAQEQFDNAKALESVKKSLTVLEGEQFDQRLEQAVLKFLEPDFYIRYAGAKPLDFNTEGAWKLSEVALRQLEPLE